MLESLIRNPAKGSITYPKWPLIFLTPAIAYALLAYVEEFSHQIAWVTPAFYVAWLVSAIIIVALICIVNWITVRFDAYYPWHEEVKRRMKKQFIGGFFIPVCFAFISAACYFTFFSINIFNTIWIKRYLPAVLFFLGIINLFFGFYGSFMEAKERIAAALRPPVPLPLLANAVTEPQERIAVAETVVEDLIPKALINAEWLDIACVFCCNKHYYAVDFEGKIDAWSHHITDSERLLPVGYFCLIDRSFVVNFSAITNVKAVGSKATHIILLPQVVEGIVNTYLKAVGEAIEQVKEEHSPLKNKLKAKKQLDPKKFVLSVSYDKKATFLAARDQVINALKLQLLSLKSKKAKDV